MQAVAMATIIKGLEIKFARKQLTGELGSTPEPPAQGEAHPLRRWGEGGMGPLPTPPLSGAINAGWHQHATTNPGGGGWITRVVDPSVAVGPLGSKLAGESAGKARGRGPRRQRHLSAVLSNGLMSPRWRQQPLIEFLEMIGAGGHAAPQKEIFLF